MEVTIQGATYTTSSALIFGKASVEGPEPTFTIVSTIRHTSLKLAAVAWRKTALDISRARVSREDT